MAAAFHPRAPHTTVLNEVTWKENVYFILFNSQKNSPVFYEFKCYMSARSDYFGKDVVVLMYISSPEGKVDFLSQKNMCGRPWG